MLSLKNAALAYAAQGWHVFPLHTPHDDKCSCPRPDCQHIGKHPRIKGGFKAATADPEQIHAWWSQWPDANIGIATGAPSGIVVIDSDGPEGKASLAKLGPIPETWVSKTGKGCHLVFASGGMSIGNRTRVAPGVDIRGDGGYIVAPPSLHASGHRYTWERASGEKFNIATLPANLIPDLEKLSKPAAQPAASKRIAEGTRNSRLTEIAGAMLGKGKKPEVALEELSKVNSERCDPPLPQKDVERIVDSIASREERKQRTARSQSLAELKPEPVEWLWRGYIPLGMITVIDGDPGVGKSTLALDLAARVSTGREMPDGSDGIAGSVLLLTAEDDLQRVVLPRLLAMKADASRIRTLLHVPTKDGSPRPVALPDDVETIKAEASEHDVRLLIIDPLMAYLTGSANSWNDQQVRLALHPVVDMADALDIAVVVVRHLNKRAGSRAMYRGGGTIGIVGASRAAFLLAHDPEETDCRVLAPVKANLGPLPKSQRVRIEPVDGSSRVAWDGTAPYTADALLAEMERDDRRGAPKLEQAKDFLRDVLREGEVKATEVNRRAAERNISARTLERARGDLEVVARGKPSMLSLPGDGGGGEQPPQSTIGGMDGTPPPSTPQAGHGDCRTTCDDSYAGGTVWMGS